MHRDPKIVCMFGKYRLQEIAWPKWSISNGIFILARTEKSDKTKSLTGKKQANTVYKEKRPCPESAKKDLASDFSNL